MTEREATRSSPESPAPRLPLSRGLRWLLVYICLLVLVDTVFFTALTPLLPHYVHVDGLTEPVVASRSERAILADVEVALAEAAGLPRRRRTAAAGQESLL